MYLIKKTCKRYCDLFLNKQFKYDVNSDENIQKNNVLKRQIRVFLTHYCN